MLGIQMGNNVVTPTTFVGVYKDENSICLSGMNDDEQLSRDCITGTDYGDGGCMTVDLGDGYEGEVCYRRSGPGVNSFQVQQPLSTGISSQSVPLSNGISSLSTLSSPSVRPQNNNTVWEVQNGNSRPITLSESDIRRLNNGRVNGRRNGDLRIEPLNNGGISIRFN